MELPVVGYVDRARLHASKRQPPSPGMLFTPDISGFTYFINHTEIEHSQHIIAELLEVIIDHTGPDFDISEI